MDELKGMDFLRQLRGRYKVILVTGKAEYAVESYDYNVADYLLKPIAYDRFLRAIQKVFDPDTPVPKHVGMIPPRMNEQNSDAMSTEDSLVLDVTKTERGASLRIRKRVRFNDIIRVESDKNYVDIFLASEAVTALITLNELQNLLPNQQFIRVHKSHIISIKYFDYLHDNTIYLTGSIEVPLGATYRESFHKAIEEKFNFPTKGKRSP